jgi:hypothetical protein
MGLKSGEILGIKKLLRDLISQKGQNAFEKGRRFIVRILVKDVVAENPTPIELRHELLIKLTGTGFFPSISSNNPCSFGLNVITLEQK